MGKKHGGKGRIEMVTPRQYFGDKPRKVKPPRYQERFFQNPQYLDAVSEEGIRTVKMMMGDLATGRTVFTLPMFTRITGSELTAPSYKLPGFEVFTRPQAVNTLLQIACIEQQKCALYVQAIPATTEPQAAHLRSVYQSRVNAWAAVQVAAMNLSQMPPGEASVFEAMRNLSYLLAPYRAVAQLFDYSGI